MDQYVDGFRTNDILRDKASGEYVLLTNGKCVLNHTAEGYNAAAHADGCRWAPFEGLVFKGPPEAPVTWGMKELTGRQFEKAPEREALLVRLFYDRRIAEIAEQAKRRKPGLDRKGKVR